MSDFYQVSNEDLGPVACACGNCDWTGNACQVQPIVHCILTPGDAVPVGRCIKCGELVYPRNIATTFTSIQEELPPENVDIVVELVTGIKLMGRNLQGTFSPYDLINDRFVEWTGGDADPFSGIARWMRV